MSPYAPICCSANTVPSRRYAQTPTGRGVSRRSRNPRLPRIGQFSRGAGPGQRLPTWRSAAVGSNPLRRPPAEHGDGPDTLRVLEDRGVVEARPRSGFYIKFRNQLPEPLPQPLRLEASPVEVSKLRYQAFSIGNAKGIVPLSVAVPSPEILSHRKARTHDLSARPVGIGRNHRLR